MVPLFRSLQNPVFARLYLAQTISLLGDALTWLGLALLAFDLAGEDSAVVLSSALTLRVMAFVLLSPLAGSVADRFDRKTILVVTHLARMVLVSLLPFVNAVWQIYAIVFALNVFYAFFTPTYQATIPLVTGQQEYPEAIALSSATFQLLGVLGPGIAGSVAAYIGAKQVFFLDGITFLIAAILIVTLPQQLRIAKNTASTSVTSRTWQDIKAGTTRLFADAPLRYALGMQLVASITGAQILVNTVGYVQGTLNLSSTEYGWVMAAFGIGATIGAVAVGAIGSKWARTTIVLLGALLITIALLPADQVELAALMLLWLVAGIGQTGVNVTTQTLIADQIPNEFQGRVYGAQFAWSHLWWMFSYPLAGLLGSHASDKMFLYSGLIGLLLLCVIQLTLAPKNQKHGHSSFWHDHEHTHHGIHQHEHAPGISLNEPHTHLHHHAALHHHHAHTSATHQHHKH
jgi:MFS transporter, NRE family, putaive nickel resistance protein